MTWPGFFAPLGAWLFFLIGPLIVLYFLKLKRPRQEVPSLVLWRQVLNDNRVNSPLQKFKRNLLLLLQLLLLILLILAAMQPYLRGDVSSAMRLPVLIDNSASMAALDQPGGVSRLDAARKRINDVIDGLPTDQMLSIISFANSARKLTDFTDNKRILRDALNALGVEDVPSDIQDALRLTAALAQTEPFERVLLLSDGNFPARTDFALPFKLDYQKLEPAGANFGITAFNARRAGRGKWDVFVSIEGSQPQPGAPARSVNVTVELDQDGQPAGNPQTVVLAQGQMQRLVFTVNAEQATALELRIKVDDFDALASDNTAYLDLAPARPVWVYVPESLVAYRLALRGVPDLRVFPEPGQSAMTETDFDLVISDQPKDVDLTARARFFVGFVPDDLADLISIREEAGGVVDWLRTADVLRYVELTDLMVLDQPVTDDPEVNDGTFEQRGYEVLMHGKDLPLLLRRRVRDDLTYHLLFHTDRSTLPYRVGFPLLVSNLVNIAMFQAGLSEVAGNTTGVLPPIKLLPQVEYRVRAPDGATRDEKSDVNAMLTGIPAPRVGRYTVEQTGLGGKTVAQVGASLLSAGESALMGEKQMQFNEQVVEASAATARTDYSYWRTLAMIALALLALEWWYFQRKPGGWRA